MRNLSPTQIRDIKISIHGALEELTEICSQMNPPQLTVQNLIAYGLMDRMDCGQPFNAGYNTGLLQGLSAGLDIRVDDLLVQFGVDDDEYQRLWSEVVRESLQQIRS